MVIWIQESSLSKGGMELISSRARKIHRKNMPKARGGRGTTEKAAVRSALGDYIRSVENEDLRLYGRVVEKDPRTVNFGTDATERIVGWEALKKVIQGQFDALSDTKITARNVTVNIAPGGRFAWATSMWDFRAKMGEQALALPVRCSWVLEKKGKRWVIVHFHKSVGTTS
jgi:hypothetical protein